MENKNHENSGENKYLKDHNKTKMKLRKIGFICVGIGGLFAIIAFIDFFSAFGGFEGPKLFFLFFISFPLLAVGGVCLSYGYMKEVGTYVASQAAPVAKNVSNYMLDGTREEVGKTIRHVADSFRGKSNQKNCPKCNSTQDEDAKFCDDCGASLAKVCGKCKATNDSDATYCKHCGYRL